MSSDDSPTTVSIDGAELEALRMIARDWVAEDLVARPYPEPVASVLDTLGVDVRRETLAAEAVTEPAIERPPQLDNAPLRRQP